MKLAANAIHDNESTFSRESVIKDALKLSVGKYTNADIEASFDSLLNKEFLQVGKQYATAEMVRIEHEILSEVLEGQNTKNSVSSAAKIEKKLCKHLHLTTGQRQAVELIATTKDQVIGIQGDAGTGKTTVLKTAKEVIEKEGYRLRGLAFTGKAANEIEQASGIKSSTLHSFLGTLENEEKATAEIGKNEIWVVDEASLVGSRQLKSLIDASGKYDARLVLIGDTKQLAAVNAGKIFKELQEHGMATVRMTETLRQTDETYKSIVSAISEHRLEDAFDLIRENGKIEIAEKGDLSNKVCADYLKSNIEKTIIVTDTNRNRQELNSQIREQLKAEGKLTGEAVFNTLEPKNITGINRNFANSYEEGNRLVFTKAGAGSRAGTIAKVVSVDTHNHTLNYEIKKKDGSSEIRELNLKEHGDKVSVFKEYETEFAEGDKVLFAKNDKMFDVQNGSTGTVKKINGDQLSVKMQNGDSKKFSIDQYRYLSHGYAITDYKSQGQTADKVLVHATTSDMEKTFNSFYVSSTRGRNDFKIYTDNDSKLMEQVKLEQEKTSTITKKSAEQAMNHTSDKSEISNSNEVSEGKGISKTAEIEIII